MAGGGSPQDDKNSMDILWIMFLVFGICAFIWWQFSAELKTFFVWLKLKELWLISSVLGLIGMGDYSSRMYTLVQGIDPLALDKNTATVIANEVGSYLRYPIALILGAYGLYVFSYHIKMRFRKHYDMRKLVSQEKNVWPGIKIVDNLDLVAMDLNSGPWAMSKTPIMFCRDYKLIKPEYVPPLPGTIEAEKKFKCSLLKQRSASVFARQLGDLWSGVERMPKHWQALFAAFIARGARDGKNSKKIIDQLASSAAKGSLDYTGIDTILAKYINDKEIVKNVTSKHAFNITVMLAALEFARLDGVFPSADFLWLKPIDRTLWFSLNSLGRKTAHVEGSGPFAHYMFEKALGKPYSTPMISEAVLALEVAVSEIIFVPTDEEREYALANYAT